MPLGSAGRGEEIMKVDLSGMSVGEQKRDAVVRNVLGVLDEDVFRKVHHLIRFVIRSGATHLFSTK
jgi:hypothetical protein